jgi:hypothetical protein
VLCAAGPISIDLPVDHLDDHLDDSDSQAGAGWPRRRRTHDRARRAAGRAPGTSADQEPLSRLFLMIYFVYLDKLGITLELLRKGPGFGVHSHKRNSDGVPVSPT